MKKILVAFAVCFSIVFAFAIESAQAQMADKKLAETFLNITGNSYVASRVVFYQTAAIVESVNSLLRMNGYPVKEQGFWTELDPELKRMTAPHYLAVQDKFTKFVQKNFTNEELKAIITFFSSGAGKKYGEVWNKAEFMAFYVNPQLGDALYAKILGYAKNKKGVVGVLKAE